MRNQNPYVHDQKEELITTAAYSDLIWARMPSLAPRTHGTEDELRRTPLMGTDLMQIQVKERGIPGCQVGRRGCAAVFWSNQVDAAAQAEEDGDKEQWRSFRLLQWLCGWRQEEEEEETME